MDRTLLWQAIATVAITVGFAYKSFNIYAKGTLMTMFVYAILLGFVVGSVLVTYYVFDQVWS